MSDADGVKKDSDPPMQVPPPAATGLSADMPLTSQGVSTTGRSEPYEWSTARVFRCPAERTTLARNLEGGYGPARTSSSGWRR